MIKKVFFIMGGLFICFALAYATEPTSFETLYFEDAALEAAGRIRNDIDKKGIGDQGLVIHISTINRCDVANSDISKKAEKQMLDMSPEETIIRTVPTTYFIALDPQHSNMLTLDEELLKLPHAGFSFLERNQNVPCAAASEKNFQVNYFKIKDNKIKIKTCAMSPHKKPVIMTLTKKTSNTYEGMTQIKYKSGRDRFSTPVYHKLTVYPSFSSKGRRITITEHTWEVKCNGFESCLKHLSKNEIDRTGTERSFFYPVREKSTIEQIKKGAYRI
jgi:hypothetical protein